MWVLKTMHERVSFNAYKHIENILETLSKHHVSATFFMTGEIVKKHPKLAQRICRMNHEIASHSHSHRSFGEASYAEAMKDIAESMKVLSRFQKVEGFRAPYLVRNKETYLACEKLGLSYDSSEHGLTKYCPDGFKVTVLPVVSPVDTHGLDLMRLRAKALVATWISQFEKSEGAAVCMHAWRIGRKKYVKAVLEPLLKSKIDFVRACDLVHRRGAALTFDLEYTSFSESLPHNISLLRSPAWKHPDGLTAREFLKDQS